MTLPSQPTSPAGVSEPQRHGWMHRISGLLFVLLTLELGLFLLIYPWMEAWDRNFVVQWRADWRPFLLSHEFRGALSGLGVLNLFIAAGEIVRAMISALRGHD